MATERPAPPRVLLLAGCYADAGPAIALAVPLAARMQAALEGVLALDPRAEAAEGAALVTGRRGVGATLLLSREGLSLAYAADARAFRGRLERAAAALALRASFRVDTGALPDLALGLRRPGDAVVLGYRRFLPLRGPVIALEDGEDGPAAAIAADLARTLGLRARVLPADTAPAALDPLPIAALVLPHSVQSDPGRLAALIDAARCPVLLAPAH
jgi:hypothetical protein